MSEYLGVHLVFLGALLLAFTISKMAVLIVLTIWTMTAILNTGS